MHVPVGLQPGPGAFKRLHQIALVQSNDWRYVFSFGGNQRARKLVAGELGLGCDQDQDLVQVGCKRLGANFVLAVKKVAPGLDLLNRAFVLRSLPQHPVAHHTLAFFAARMADQALALCGFNQKMAAIVRNDQPARPHFCRFACRAAL